jgi:hypothetical protein
MASALHHLEFRAAHQLSGLHRLRRRVNVFLGPGDDENRCVDRRKFVQDFEPWSGTRGARPPAFYSVLPRQNSGEGFHASRAFTSYPR